MLEGTALRCILLEGFPVGYVSKHVKTLIPKRYPIAGEWTFPWTSVTHLAECGKITSLPFLPLVTLVLISASEASLAIEC